jgi:hypothetical protein
MTTGRRINAGAVGANSLSGAFTWTGALAHPVKKITIIKSKINRMNFSLSGTILENETIMK